MDQLFKLGDNVETNERWQGFTRRIYMVEIAEIIEQAGFKVTIYVDEDV